ncbi:hypothetical protein MN0502_34160 (plasmid) [Arthrobacter sp. MN05-02]|nr:hypothetical protein MN0502_34160 [Arthrobacter sp. MN05-02]
MSGLDVYLGLCLVGGLGLAIYGAVSMRRPRRKPETPNSYPQGMIPIMLGSTLFFLAVWNAVGL